MQESLTMQKLVQAEPLAKIGLAATGKKSKRKKRTGIVFETQTDIYALYYDLTEKGVIFIVKPTKMEWGGIVADFLDPDNNVLEVVQDANHYNPKIVTH